MMVEFTPKQSKFMDEYMVDLNATQAAIRAGYSQKTAKEQASRLLSNVNIQSELGKRRAELAESTRLSAGYVLERLRSVAERCMTAEPVLDKDGNPTGEYKFDSGGANRSLELLGKHLGMFKDKVELEVVGSIAEQLKTAREALRNGPK